METEEKKHNYFSGFLAGAFAAVGAVTFTNPAEVLKVRLQLQGELLSKNTPKAYSSLVSGFTNIYRNEGLAGIQRGLLSAYYYQILLNGFRLGSYDPIKNTFISIGLDSNLASISGGALSGVLGAAMASPFLLVKTRMQSYTKGSLVSVGHQHSYVEKGVVYSLKTIYKNEGTRGLWRGCGAAMMRTGVGSSVQLPSYEFIKFTLVEKGFFRPNDPALHFVSSLGTGLIVTAAMNPFDLAMSRIYNQKNSQAYSGLFDCIFKTVKVEGLGALYKGFFAHFLRLGPHTILTLVFLEQSRKLLGVSK